MTMDTSIIKNMVMFIVGNNSVKYYLCFNAEESTVLALLDDMIFTSSLEYMVPNGILHAINCDGKIVDHSIDKTAWNKFKNYCGIYETNIEHEDT